MATTRLFIREERRKKIAEKYRKQRAALKVKTTDLNLTPEQRFEAQQGLQELPRDSSRIRQRNRCRITGRSRGVFRQFNLCRHMLREMILKGNVPGVVKASW
jgi:small subunit ribosomal protein S14